MTEPQGVTAVLIDPQRRVSASASDFDVGGSAGITQEEAQRYRVKRAVAVDYINASCNGYLGSVLRSGYPGADGIIQKLVADHGFTLHFIAHGYPESNR